MKQKQTPKVPSSTATSSTSHKPTTSTTQPSTTATIQPATATSSTPININPWTNKVKQRG